MLQETIGRNHETGFEGIVMGQNSCPDSPSPHFDNVVTALIGRMQMTFFMEPSLHCLSQMSLKGFTYKLSRGAAIVQQDERTIPLH